jgi:aspartate-semialdehyde dehydrogenase
MLRPLEQAAGIAEAAGVVLRSAWHEGPEGREALLEQTVAVLSMRPVPREVLREQRAFNLLPAGRRTRAGREVEHALGLKEGSVRLSAVAAPYFHGCAARVWVRTREPLPADSAERLLREAPGLDVEEGESVSPVAAAESPVARCLPPSEDGGGLWLWGAADPVSAGAAVEAVRLAGAMLGGRAGAAGERS